MKKIFIIFIFSFWYIYAEKKRFFPISQSEIYKKVGLEKKDLSKIEIKLPSKETFDLAWTWETSLVTWIEKLRKEDRKKDKYLVLPTQGLIIPINDVPKNSKAYKNYMSGKNENFVEYLNNWTVEIPLTSANWYGSHWNKVIAWHSSYWKDKPAFYKTHFQKIIWMEKWDEIWIFERNKKWFFDKYIYKVTKSYNTDDEDISILESRKNKSELTLFTCTPIWWITWRWIVKAEFLSKN